MRKYLTSGLALSVIIALSGCGGSDDGSTTPTTSTTGTGYYVDSAVEGVNYQCGDQNGTTDSAGTFKFQVGADCQFTLAGVTLRTVPAAQLTDGGKVVEDNITVATFLQTLDIDGDAANGIQISKEVAEAVQTVVQVTKTVPADDATLSEIYNILKNDVATYQGKIVTPEEAKEHLNSNLTPTTPTTPSTSSTNPLNPIVPYTQSVTLPYEGKTMSIKVGADGELEAVSMGGYPIVKLVDGLTTMTITQMVAEEYIVGDFPDEGASTIRVTLDFAKGTEHIVGTSEKYGSADCVNTYTSPLPVSLSDQYADIPDSFSESTRIATTCPDWVNETTDDNNIPNNFSMVSNTTITSASGKSSHISQDIELY